MESGHDSDPISLLRWGKKYLRDAGIDDFEISAEVLLGNLLNLNRSRLLLSPEIVISHDQVNEYKDLIQKRSERVPLQYLTGSVEFYNVKIKCDSRALIPRPETEILVETMLRVLRGSATVRILDIGTGSGNIAIALAKNIPDSEVIGMDISKEALELAQENAILNDVQSRVTFILGDIRDESFVRTLGLFDSIVSNPPYVAEYEKEKLQPEVIKFEPAVALFSPGDPLAIFKVILQNVSYILRSGGLMVFEVGLKQAREVRQIMSGEFSGIEITRDLTGAERVVTGIYNKPGGK